MGIACPSGSSSKPGHHTVTSQHIPCLMQTGGCMEERALKLLTPSTWQCIYYTPASVVGKSTNSPIADFPCCLHATAASCRVHIPL